MSSQQLATCLSLQVPLRPNPMALPLHHGGVFRNWPHSILQLTDVDTTNTPGKVCWEACLREGSLPSPHPIASVHLVGMLPAWAR